MFIPHVLKCPESVDMQICKSTHRSGKRGGTLGGGSVGGVSAAGRGGRGGGGPFS